MNESTGNCPACYAEGCQCYVEVLPKYWGCVTCGQEFPEDANWCSRCQTYKNFDWIDVEDA